MDIIEETPITKWLARIFLAIIVIGIIWWFTTRHDDFEYVGLKQYHKESALTRLFRQFIPEKEKPKRENKTENKCRKIIEKIYGKPFPSVRPNFLRSPMTKKNLELDCYNEELRIALEYNGKQHYSYTPHFHKKGKKQFYAQVHRDDWKRKKCRELGIHLIEIPYWVIPIDLEEYITRELRKKGCL